MSPANSAPAHAGLVARVCRTQLAGVHLCPRPFCSPAPAGTPMSAAVQPAHSGTPCYRRRRPEHSLWYRIVQAHFETWLALAVGSDASGPPAYVEPAFRRYIECGILSRGFARAFCKACGRRMLPCALPSPRRRRPPARLTRRRTAPPSVICARCCWRAAMKFFRRAARSVMPRCGSSPASPNPQPCAKFLNISVRRPGCRASPRRGF